MDFKMTKDNRKQVIDTVNNSIIRALEICGGKAESYGKDNLTKQNAVDTGALRNSVTHNVDTSKKVCYIGTNMSYAPYIEFGTGIHYVGGRRTSWLYQDDKGEWHKTNGMKPRPYIEPALSQHKDEYETIIKKELGKI